MAAGYGDRRPSRDPAEFVPFLDGLRDPAIADLVRILEPISDVVTYRQTGNRRHSYGEHRAWPDSLIVVGDAYCAFNPIYGQGITVAACQAVLLRDTLAKNKPLRSRRLQRRIAAVADFPWSVATTEDIRRPSSTDELTRSQQVIGRWTGELAKLAAHGERGAYRAFVGVYHLMAAPALLFHPGSVPLGSPDCHPRHAACSAATADLGRLRVAGRINHGKHRGQGTTTPSVLTVSVSLPRPPTCPGNNAAPG